MTLQVRLVHALGDQLIDLPEKTFESPLVIGRATTADVQIPATTVSRRHSLLYVHEGQWYVQDGNGGARTLVNGQPTPEPTPVNSGDVIALGTEPAPPTLTIDPYGLLPSVGAAQAAEPAAAAVEAYVPPQPAAPSKRYPTPRSSSVASPGLPQPGAPRGGPLPQIGAGYGAALPQIGAPAQPEAPVEEPAADDWMTPPAASAGSQKFYVPKQQGMSPGLIAVVVFCGLAIIGGAGYWYHVRQQAEDERVRVELEKNKKVKVEVVKNNNIFEQAENERKQAALKALAANANKPKVASVSDAAAQDPGRQTDEWLKVKEAHDSFKPMEAIVIFGDYLKQFPRSPYAGDVHKFTEDALDAIWWDHITELAQQRDDANKEIVAKNRDIAQSQDPEFKKSLQDEKLVLEEKLQIAQDKLKEMNYASEEKPNLNDEALMGDLRRARNPVKYEEWKKMAEKKIKETRGQRSVW